MSDITLGREAVFESNKVVLKTLTDTFDMLNRVLVGAVADDDRDRVEYLGMVLQVVSDNLASAQHACAMHDMDDEDFEDDEHTAITVVDMDGGKHGVLGYTLTVQRPDSEQVEHAGAVFDIYANATLLFETIEEARAHIGSLIFEPGSTVHISEVYSVEDVETVTK